MTSVDISKMEFISQKQDVTDRVFFLGLVVGLIYYMIPETTLDVPDVILLLIKALLFFLLTLQLVIAFPKYAPRQKLFLTLLFFIVVLIGYHTTRWGTVYSFYALIVGAKGIDFKKILNVYFIVGAGICITVVVLSNMGIIENKLYYSDSHGFSDNATIRYCMGYTWPTDFASHVFFIILSYWMLKEARMTVLRLLSILSITYFVFYYSDSQLGCGCIVLLVLSSFIIKLKEWIKKKYHQRFDSIYLRILWILYIPFLFFLLVWMTASYDSSDIVWIALNTLLSSRLSISQDALESKGYTLFGQEYELIGGDANSNLYNYIDSSYLQSLIIYGIAFSLALLLISIYIANQAFKRKDNTILYAILVAGLSGAIAQHFLQIFMNPLFYALTALNTNYYSKK